MESLQLDLQVKQIMIKYHLIKTPNFNWTFGASLLYHLSILVPYRVMVLDHPIWHVLMTIAILNTLLI